MPIVYITGIKHSGKSNLGYTASTIIKKTTPVTFVDLDSLILDEISHTYPSIRDYYTIEGKEAFMALEYRVLVTYVQTITESEVHIISTGGGICDYAKSVEWMKKTGIIVYLSLPEQALYTRIIAKGIPPFLSGDNIRSSFGELYKRRDRIYSNNAHFVLPLSDSKSIEENGSILAELLSTVL